MVYNFCIISPNYTLSIEDAISAMQSHSPTGNGYEPSRHYYFLVHAWLLGRTLVREPEQSRTDRSILFDYWGGRVLYSTPLSIMDLVPVLRSCVCTCREHTDGFYIRTPPVLKRVYFQQFWSVKLLKV
jgi:hypothetical protein